VALKVIHHYGRTRDLAEALQQRNHRVVLEVMQKQRAMHNIEARRAKREAERVRDDTRLGRRSNVMELVVERRHMGLGVGSADDARRIARSSAHVEDTERLGRSYEAEGFPQSLVATEKPVDPNQIAKACGSGFRRLVVENLGFYDAARLLKHDATIEVPYGFRSRQHGLD
jgi:hypothetical protein